LTTTFPETIVVVDIVAVAIEAAAAEGLKMSESLTPAMFNVLLALADGDKHGYAILKEVPEIGTGTLYGIIKRLLADGLISETERRPAFDHDDQRRRYYRLTAAGREAAVAEATRLSALVARARSKRLLRALKPA
jgi:DNA-binding PadR family transcriptional regulator